MNPFEDTPEMMDRCLSCPYDTCRGSCRYLYTGEYYAPDERSPADPATITLDTRIPIDGKYLTVKSVAHHYRISAEGLKRRLRTGCPPEEAVQELIEYRESLKLKRHKEGHR